MTTTDEAGLMAAILADPADDGPRLVYADWLDEHVGDADCGGCGGSGVTVHTSADSGKFRSFKYRLDCTRCNRTGRVPNTNAERAEFIRVQVALAACQDCVSAAGVRVGRDITGRPCSACIARQARERELWAVHSRAWFVDESIGLSAGLDGFAGPAGSLLGIVRRGFVAEIVTSVAALFGGPCPRCEGRGWSYDDSGGNIGVQAHCHACNSSGRTAGCAKELFAAHPLTMVVLSDKRPAADEGRGIWYAESAHAHEAVTIPAALIPAMNAEVKRNPKAYALGDMAVFPTEADAVEAMSAAACQLGRTFAGRTARGPSRTTDH